LGSAAANVVLTEQKILEAAVPGGCRSSFGYTPAGFYGRAQLGETVVERVEKAPVLLPIHLDKADARGPERGRTPGSRSSRRWRAAENRAASLNHLVGEVVERSSGWSTLPEVLFFVQPHLSAE
jgi:hypothetical protein